MYKQVMKIIGIVSAALLVGTADVQARPSKEVEITFYSDSSLKTEVGSQTLPCNGGIIKRGKKTKFYQRTEEACENTPLPSSAPINCNFTQAGCDPLLPKSSQ